MHAQPISDSVRRQIRELIRITSANNERRLPSIEQLCALFSASHYTVWKVLDALRKNGDLAVEGKQWVISNGRKSGKGAYQPASHEPRYDHPKWKSIYRTLQTDITNGRYTPGVALPGIKALSGTYGANRKTVQKAVNLLLKESWLIQDGCRYTIPAVTNRYAQTVILIASGSVHGWLHLFSGRGQDLLRAHMNICGEKGLRLKIVTCELDGSLYCDGIKSEIRQLLANDSVLGTIFWTLSIAEPVVIKLITQIQTAGRPLSIYDEGSGIAFSESVRTSRTVNLFGSNDFQAGMIVGQYLMRLGHKHIRYISPFEKAVWSEARLSGLQRITGSSNGEIIVCACMESPADRKSRPGVYDRLSRVIDEEIEGKGFDDLHTAHLLGLNKEIDAAGNREIIPPDDARLMDAALQDARSTAWVAANDDVAIQCLRYLEKKRIDVPGAISVIGFDDCLEALYAQLSSYNFNSTAITHAMINALGGVGRLHLRKESGGCRSVKGFVDERRSCGPVPVPVRDHKPGLEG